MRVVTNRVQFKNVSRVWVLAHALFVFLAWTSPASAGICDAYRKVAGLFFAHKREASQTDYDKARTHWISVFGGGARPTLETVLAKLKEKGDGSPETLMALMDTLNPSASVSFAEWMKRLDAEGIDVKFVKDTDLDKLTDRHDTKWHWSLEKKFPPVARRPYLLEIRTPDSVPKNAKELYTRLYALSLGMPGALMDVTSAKSPVLSSPVGNASYSYPKQLRDAIQATETRVYDTIHEWEKRWGTPPVELAENGPGKWLGGYSTMPIALAWKALFPMYNPAKRFRPSKDGYRAYEKGRGQAVQSLNPLTKRIHDQYQVAGTTKWVVDQYVRGLKGLGLYGLGAGAVGLYNFFADGWYSATQAVGNNLANSLDDPEELNRRLKKYEENKEGDPFVLETYNPQIAEVEKQIREKGDPDGSLAKRRDALIEERDFFKN